MHLLRTARFAPLFVTQFLGAFNDNLFKSALVMLITYQSMSVMGMGKSEMSLLAAGLFIAPYVLLSATAGQLSDNIDKARVIRWTKTIEIAAACVGAAGFLLGVPWLLVAVLVALGAQSAAFGPSKYGILPEHLADDELLDGNAWVEAGTYLAILGGTLVGGLLYDKTWLIAGSVVVVAVAGRVAAQFVPPAPPTSEVTVQWDPVRPTMQLVKLCRSDRTVWLAVLGISWFWMFGAAFLSLFPAYTETTLGGDNTLATLFLALFSIGIAAGSAVCAKLSHERVELGLVPIGSVGMALFTADLWLIGTPWPAPAVPMGVSELLSTFTGWRIAIDMLGLSASGGLLVVPLYALLQQRSKADERARVIAGNNIVNAFWTVVGTGVLMGLSTFGLSTTQIFGVLAVVTVAVSAYMYWVVREFALRFVVFLFSHVLYRIRVDGHDHIPDQGPAVLVANHVSFIDWFVLAAALRRPPRFVMAKVFHELPVVSVLFKQAGTIPIVSRKTDPQAMEAAFERIHEALQEGWLVLIFPEGKITDDGTLSDFRGGVERIIARDPVPVVPIALNGLWGSFFSRKGGPAMRKPFRRRPLSRIWVTVGEPVEAARASATTLQQAVSGLWAQRLDAP